MGLLSAGLRAGPDGKPWHSWRVLILENAPHPYSELYKAYRFDEPWDGPHNAKLAGQIGDYYRRQGVDRDETDSTGFVAVIGPGTAWPGATTRSTIGFSDGPARRSSRRDGDLRGFPG